MVPVGDVQRGRGKGEAGRVTHDPEADPHAVELRGGIGLVISDSYE